MKNQFDFDSVLCLIDKAINPSYLSSTQEIVLREVWNGKTYSEMACDYNYDTEYIKGVGCNLWQTLSRAFDNQINKSNFVPFMRQRMIQAKESQESYLMGISVPSTDSNKSASNSTSCHWTTAPSTKDFIGREQEIATLEEWIAEPNCRCIVISGMIGCGKTLLATQLARKVQHKYDRVIWLSLLQTPPLRKLLNRYLALIDPEYKQEQKLESAEISFLLSRFIDCLRKQKILLVIDGLQSILQVNQTNISYEEQFEEYGQLLRSLISTNHKSTLIATSRLKPKQIEYYSNNQVKFLDLQGFNSTKAKEFLQAQGEDRTPVEMLDFIDILQGNPQFLKIAHNHLFDFIDCSDDTEQILNDIGLLEEIANLLEVELSYASGIEKEIIYWLAICCSPISFKQLCQNIPQSRRKLEFVQCLNRLEKRSLIHKEDKKYSLMPLLRVYLRRKLVQQALQNNH